MCIRSQFLPLATTRPPKVYTNRFCANFSFDFKTGDYHENCVRMVKILHSKGMASEQANMLISTGLTRPRLLALCILKAQEVTMKGVY